MTNLSFPLILVLLSKIKSEAPDILNNIKSSGKIDESNEEKLKIFITNFKRGFQK